MTCNIKFSKNLQ